jgi:hypothetical protein
MPRKIAATISATSVKSQVTLPANVDRAPVVTAVVDAPDPALTRQEVVTEGADTTVARCPLVTDETAQGIVMNEGTVSEDRADPTRADATIRLVGTDAVSLFLY